IYTVDLNGSEQRLVTDEVVGFRRDRWPEYTRDGAWVYFGVSQQPYSLQPSLWRAKGDGSAPVQVDSFATFFDYEPEPSPSPDGSAERVFAPDQNFNLGLSWSPDGAWLIARAASSLVLIRVADGLVLPLAFTVAYLQEPAWRP